VRGQGEQNGSLARDFIESEEWHVMNLDKFTDKNGMQYWYAAPPIVLPVGTAPAAGNGYLGVPGAPVTTEFTIINNDFVGIDLLAVSNGAFLCSITVASVTLMAQGANALFQGAHSTTIFGPNAGQPNRLFIPFTAPLQNIVRFTLQDVSYVANNLVYITINGVQKKQVG
jgi:hypothetical protein